MTPVEEVRSGNHGCTATGVVKKTDICHNSTVAEMPRATWVDMVKKLVPIFNGMQVPALPRKETEGIGKHTNSMIVLIILKVTPEIKSRFD